MEKDNTVLAGGQLDYVIQDGRVYVSVSDLADFMAAKGLELAFEGAFNYQAMFTISGRCLIELANQIDNFNTQKLQNEINKSLEAEE